MEKLMSQGWRFELFQNKLDTYSCIARKGDQEIAMDNFRWWPLINDIVAACDKAENSKAQHKR